MDKLKCPTCNKVLFECEIRDGTIRKKCPRCKNVVTLIVENGEKAKITVNK